MRLLHNFFLFVILSCFAQPEILCSQNIYTTNETVLKIIKKYRTSAKKQNTTNKKKLLYIAAGTLVVASSVAGFYLYSNNINDEPAKQLFSNEMDKHSNVETALQRVSKSYPNTKISSILNYFTSRESSTPQGITKTTLVPPPPPPAEPFSFPSNNQISTFVNNQNANNQMTQQSVQSKNDAPLRTNVLPIEPKAFEAQKLLLKNASQRKIAEKKINPNQNDSLFKQFSNSELLNKVKKANQDPEYDSDEEWEDQ